jgi:polar amino acid transport system ATP-binding protein/sulfate transport system ATP-binding protein
VVIDGENRAVRAGEVGVVAQDYPLFEHRTVMGNLMRAACKRYPNKEARERVVGYLAEFDLSAEVHRYPTQLSGGQRQRVAILQQVLCGSQTLLMDEPFSGLDPIAKKKTQILIQKIANLDDKNTIIVVTHDIAAAAAVADHLWAMGRDHYPQGKVIPGAYIVETYNLIDRGLAWDPNIERNAAFAPFVQEVEDKFAEL